jgi:tellurite resistance protein TehA-like permease
MPSTASCATRIEPRGTPVIGETIWSSRGSYNRPNDLVVVVDDETYMSDDSMSSQDDDPWNAEDEAFDEENVRLSCEQLESSLHARHDVLAFDGRTGRTTVDHAGKEQSSFNCDAAADAAAKIQLQEAAASQEKDLEFDTASSRASSKHAASRICSVVRTRRSWSQPASPVAATKAYKLSISPDRTKQFSGPLPRLHHHLHSLVVSGGGAGSPKIHDPAIDEFTATASSPVPTPRRAGNYGLFRTRSSSRVNPGRIHLEPDELSLRSPSPLHGRHGEIEEEEEFGWSDFAAQEAAPAVSPGRYFDALEGPELEKPKDSEDLLLPSDELWPFLLRFPIGVFRISLGLGCQSILWRDLHELKCMQSFVYAPYVISEVIWWLALATLLLLTIIYIAKCVVYFEAVRREFYHPVRVNYFFSPWITALFLAQTVPQYLSFNTTTSTKSTTPLQLSGPSPALWCVVMTPILALELKLYGQWLSGGERRLSKVANPSTHMSVVGNFAGAKVAALVGWREAAILFWAVGLAHYLVLFVTLYQRLPSNVVLPKEMQPLYFLFVAVPSSASVAWRYITGQFGSVCKILFFISLFLYSSLGVRFNFFRGCRYSTGTTNIFDAVLSILDTSATFH